jgi:hypothetical protein
MNYLDKTHNEIQLRGIFNPRGPYKKSLIHYAAMRDCTALLHWTSVLSSTILVIINEYLSPGPQSMVRSAPPKFSWRTVPKLLLWMTCIARRLHCWSMLVVLARLPDHTPKRTGPLRRGQNAHRYLINCDSSEDENGAVLVVYQKLILILEKDWIREKNWNSSCQCLMAIK